MGTRVRFTILYLARFADNFGYVAILTLLPVYVNLLDPSGLVIGLFVAGLAIGRTIAGIPLGWAADRYDKRALLIASLVTSIVAFVLFAFADGSTELIIARTLQGFGSIGAGMITLALVSELAPAGERGTYIGRFNAWRLAAGIVGTLGVGLAYDLFGFGSIYGALVVMHLLALSGLWLYVEADESTVENTAYVDLALNPRIISLSSFRSLYAVSMTLVQTWIPIYAGITVANGGLGLATFAVGTVLAAEKITNMLMQPYTGTLSDKHGRELFILLGGGTYGIVALAVPFTPTLSAIVPGPVTIPMLGILPPVFFVILALNALFGIADSFREPASMAVFADEGTDRGITSSFGIRGLVWRPGAIVAPLIGGYLMSTVGIQWVFFGAFGTALASITLYLGMLTLYRGSVPFRVPYRE